MLMGPFRTTELRERPYIFRPGTRDEKIWRSVVVGNEYRLPRFFKETDCIMDVGAHIGAFAHLCLAKGVGNVVCYEPDFENNFFCRLNLLEIHKDDPRRYKIMNFGLGAKDACGVMTKYDCLSDGEINTGSTQLVSKEEFDDMRIPAEMKCFYDELKRLLRIHDSIRLLKLDCEGAEWDILQYDLTGVQRVCGEYHIIDDRDHHDIIELLKINGFQADVENPTYDGLGHFWGTR